MRSNERAIIAGAGPVGLAAALFLTRAGSQVRLIDVRPERSPHSRALAVNPRTLEMLEPTGITRRMLELGKRVTGVRFYEVARLIGEISFANLHAKFPFMLALSQATTEALLSDALQAAGGHVDRGTKLVACREQDQGVEVTLETIESGARERVQCPWLLAADGAHSTVREQLGIDFTGSTLPHSWHLTDAPLNTRLDEACAHVFFMEEGAFLFLIRVVDPAPQFQTQAPVWRALSNRPEPLSRLVDAAQAGPPVWDSTFHVPHRIARVLSRGSIYLAGDAAHLHSPVGARGMNLGIEDAWVFSALAQAGHLSEYDRMRHTVDARVVRDVQLLSRIAAGEPRVMRYVRSTLFPIAIKARPVQSKMLSRLTGLDHPLPSI